MTAIKHGAVNLVDDLNHRQVAGQNSCQRGVLAGYAVEQRAQIEPGWTVRLAAAGGEVDHNIGFADRGLQRPRRWREFIGATRRSLTQHHALELEQSFE